MTPSSRMTIGIISAGRVGAVLGAALRRCGHRICGAYAFSEASLERLDTLLPGVPAQSPEEIARAADLVLFAVPDDELSGVIHGLDSIDALRPGQILAHVAGRFGLEVFEGLTTPVIGLALHPAMTFTGTSLDLARLSGVPWAVTGPAPFLPIAHALVAEMEGESFEVANRALYHAALCHGANHAVTLVAQAKEMLEASGVNNPGEYLRPLLQASIEGALNSGEALLTGPISRGDTGTVAAHCQAMDAAQVPNDTRAAYEALALATAERGEHRGILSASTLEEIRRILAQ